MARNTNHHTTTPASTATPTTAPIAMPAIAPGLSPLDLELLLVAEEDDAGPAAATLGVAEVAGDADVPVVVVTPPAPTAVVPPAAAVGAGVVPELAAAGDGVGVPEVTEGATLRGFAWKNDQMRPFASNTPASESKQIVVCVRTDGEVATDGELRIASLACGPRVTATGDVA